MRRWLIPAGDQRRSRRDEVGLDGVGVDPVVDFGKGAVEIPGEGEATVFVLLEAFGFLDERGFEFRTEPRAGFEGDVSVSKSAAITAGLRDGAPGTGGFRPFLGGEVEAVPPGLIFSSLEFEGFEIGVVEPLPNAEKESRSRDYDWEKGVGKGLRVVPVEGLEPTRLLKAPRF